MQRADVITLLHESPGTHGVHDEPTTEERTRYCTRRSVGRTEYYAAGAIGLQPEYVFKLAVAEDYEQEHELKYNGAVYRVIRAYETDDGGVELTAQRSDDA